jgi:uncharacterized protein
MGESQMDAEEVIAVTRRWIAGVVIELNLCPFARRVFEDERIQYVVTWADSADMLLRDLTQELNSLTAAPMSSVETTLLIHPNVLPDFLDYNDFLDRVDEQIEELGLRGTLQVASFHPDYRFADTETDAVENYTNRSPFPMLHLLREDSITALGIGAEELLEIPTRNIATLRGLGREQIDQKLAAIRDRPIQ